MLKSFAEDLKSVREEKNISLKDISARTRLNVSILENLENGEFSFQPQTYIRAFLKQYIISIGLDPEEILFDYDLARSGKYKSKRQNVSAVSEESIAGINAKDQKTEVKNSKEKIADKLKFCSVCCNITEDEVCRICSSSKRSSNVICVVEEPQDVFAVEKTNEFKGLYHVLHGIISPLDGIGPNDIKISELLIRLGKENGQRVEELILALNPTVEGETTILYLSKLLRPLDIKITRIARGIPIGSDLEFADEVTLAKALEGRVTV